MAAKRMDIENVGAQRGADAPDTAGRIKTAVAIAGLACAAGLLAWHFGIFDNPNKPLPPTVPIEETMTEPEKVEYQKFKAKQEEEAKKAPAPRGS